MIHLKPLPDLDNGYDHDWRHFAVTVPPTSPPLDMHVVWLIDGKGADMRYEQPKPWDQPIPLKFRLDRDDDSRVKTILKAQGLPVKEQVVTYRFGVGTVGGSTEINQILKFAHGIGLGGSVITTIYSPAAVGDKMMLSDEVIRDSKFAGDSRDFQDHWQQLGYLAKFAPGQVHSMTVYVQFRPHKGPVPPCFRISARNVSQ